MDIQYLIVVLIIAAAVAYAGTGVWRKTRSFSKKQGCASDCGCDATKTISKQ